MKIFLWQMVLCLTLVSVMAAAQDDKKISRKDIPSAVMKAVQQRFPADTVFSQQTTTVNDKNYFALDIRSEKHKAKLLVTPDGFIFQVREPVVFLTLPDRARTMIDLEHPRIKLTGLEMVTQDSVVTYNLQFVERGNEDTTEFIFDVGGKVLKSQEGVTGDEVIQTEKK